jgi:hypothetical protein
MRGRTLIGSGSLFLRRPLPQERNHARFRHRTREKVALSDVAAHSVHGLSAAFALGDCERAWRRRSRTVGRGRGGAALSVDRNQLRNSPNSHRGLSPLPGRKVRSNVAAPDRPILVWHALKYGWSLWLRLRCGIRRDFETKSFNSSQRIEKARHRANVS